MLPNSLEGTLASTALQFTAGRERLPVYRGETADKLGRRGASISIWLCLQTWRLLNSYGRNMAPWTSQSFRQYTEVAARTSASFYSLSVRVRERRVSDGTMDMCETLALRFFSQRNGYLYMHHLILKIHIQTGNCGWLSTVDSSSYQCQVSLGPEACKRGVPLADSGPGSLFQCQLWQFRQ